VHRCVRDCRRLFSEISVGPLYLRSKYRSIFRLGILGIQKSFTPQDYNFSALKFSSNKVGCPRNSPVIPVYTATPKLYGPTPTLNTPRTTKFFSSSPDFPALPHALACSSPPASSPQPPRLASTPPPSPAHTHVATHARLRITISRF
jgi:hypothetical protein